MADSISGYETKKSFIEAQSKLLLDSYRHWTGKSLIEIPSGMTSGQIAQALFFAPFPVLSGGTESDQILNYGNQCALDLWEMGWEELTRTPSRLTAEPLHRDQRARFLQEVRKHGYISDYQGIRISKTGRRFQIRQATVWNLLGPENLFAGQAATFCEYTFL